MRCVPCKLEVRKLKDSVEGSGSLMDAGIVTELLKGPVVLRFEFEDGSVLESVTSLNPGILKERGIDGDGLYDLQTGLPIPTEYLNLVSECRVGTKKNLSKLDEFLEVGGKFWWNNTKTSSLAQPE